MQNWFERAIIAQASKIWRRRFCKMPEMRTLELAHLRRAALEMRGALDRIIHTADRQSLDSKFTRSGSQKSARADWVWRPELWSGPIAQAGVASAQPKTKLGQEIQLFHDCKLAELTIKQFRNLRRTDLAPYGFMLDVFDFGGSYLSLAIALPQEAALGLKTRHVIDVEAIIESERPLKTFARLNIKSGLIVEQIVREFSRGGTMASLGFDLAQVPLNGKPIQEIWLDLIFEAPQMNQVKIRDLSLYRRPRHEF